MSLVERARSGGLIGPLLRNRSAAQTIFKNTLWLGVGQGITGLLNFVLAVYLSRAFGATRYGQFAFAFAFASLFGALFDFGLSTALTREIARSEERIREFPSVLALKLGLGLVAMGILATSSWLFVSAPAVRSLVVVLGFYVFLQELIYLFYAVFRARQRMEVETSFRVLQVALLAALIFGVVTLRPSIRNVAWAFVGATLATLATVVAFGIKKRPGAVSVRSMFDFRVWKSFLVVGWYLVLTKGVADLMAYTDSVILGSLGQIREVGWYNAASKINGALLFPMSFVSAAIFPALVRMSKESTERFLRYWTTWMRGTVFFAVLLAFLVRFTADDIIATFYPPEFSPAVRALQILVLTASLVYIHNLYFHALLVFDQQRRIFRTLALAAVANVVLNLVLVPGFSLNGSATATVISHSLVLLQFVLIARSNAVMRQATGALVYTVSVGIVAGLAMYASLQAVALRPVAEATLGGVGYGLAFWGIYACGRMILRRLGKERSWFRAG